MDICEIMVYITHTTDNFSPNAMEYRLSVL